MSRFGKIIGYQRRRFSEILKHPEYKEIFLRNAKQRLEGKQGFLYVYFKFKKVNYN